MNRRRLLAALASVATAAPAGLRAQQKAMSVIGYLNGSSPAANESLAAFHQGLRETGWVEGENVAIEYRYAEFHYDRLPAFAADLITRRIDLIAAAGIPAALAAKNATSTIPIVFAVGDPVDLGLVANLARPGGNLTGISTMAPELSPKRLEIIPSWLPRPKSSRCS
jgi:putative ABC transport system substrate-binding protein